MKGHRRTPSDTAHAAQFRELTLRDAKESLHNELEKLINTANQEHKTVSYSGYYDK